MINAMSLVDHPLFPQLQPYLYKVRSNRACTNREPSYRIEVVKDIPEDLLYEVEKIELDCPFEHCTGTYHPVRRRRRTKTDGERIYTNIRYIAVTCPLESSDGCCRSDEAKRAVLRIADRVEEHFPKTKKHRDDDFNGYNYETDDSDEDDDVY